MQVSTDVLFVVYIITSHMKKHSSNCFQEFKTMFKITHMKKLFEDQHVFKNEVKVRQEVNDVIKRSISYIKVELQHSIEKF